MLSSSLFAAHVARAPSCAQKVYIALADQLTLTEDDIDYIDRFGKGKAPGGQCGACYTAKTLLEESDGPKVEAEFLEKAGALTCRQIRKIDRLSCAECAQLAVDIVKRIRRLK